MAIVEIGILCFANLAFLFGKIPGQLLEFFGFTNQVSETLWFIAQRADFFRARGVYGSVAGDLRVWAFSSYCLFGVGVLRFLKLPWAIRLVSYRDYLARRKTSIFGFVLGYLFLGVGSVWAALDMDKHTPPQLVFVLEYFPGAYVWLGAFTFLVGILVIIEGSVGLIGWITEWPRMQLPDHK